MDKRLFNMLNLKKWSTSSIIHLSIFMLAAFTSIMTFFDLLGTIHFAEKEESKCAMDLVENLMSNVTIQSQARAEVIASLPLVKKAFREKNKETLITVLHEAIDGQHDKYGVDEANFYLPPATLFLELTNIQEIKEEDHSSFRKIILDATTGKKTSQGFEIGKNGLDIRGVYPVTDENGFIGVFEIGMSVINVLKLNKKISGFDAGIFVNKDIYNSVVAEGVHHLDKSHYIGNYVNQYATDNDLIKKNIKKEKLDHIVKNSFYIQKDPETKEHLGIIEVPLKNIENKQIGVIALIKNYDKYFMIEKQIIIISIAFFILQCAVLMGISNIFIKAEIIKPLHLLIELIKTRKNRTVEPSLSELENSCDEIINLKNSLLNTDFK